MQRLAGDPDPGATSVTVSPAITDRTASYLCSGALNSLMIGSVTSQTEVGVPSAETLSGHPPETKRHASGGVLARHTLSA